MLADNGGGIKSMKVGRAGIPTKVKRNKAKAKLQKKSKRKNR